MRAFNVDSNEDMLAIWEDLSVKYKRNYRADTSHEYIEVRLIVTDFIVVYIAYIYYIGTEKRRRDLDVHKHGCSHMDGVSEIQQYA